MTHFLPEGVIVNSIHLIVDGKIVCMPNMTEFHATQYHTHHQRTDDARAASCPMCKRTTVYKELMRHYAQ